MEELDIITEHLKGLDNRNGNRPIFVAIDGRCASGKTTLAEKLSKNLHNCAVVHIDDFFLPPQMRTQERLNEIGGNFDRERFIFEVVEPLMKNNCASYRVYSCKVHDYISTSEINNPSVVIVEGAYSMHPDIVNVYSYKIFCTASYETQLDRIEKRNGEEAKNRFISLWIPLEEKYFKEYNITDLCDYIYKT